MTYGDSLKQYSAHNQSGEYLSVSLSEQHSFFMLASELSMGKNKADVLDFEAPAQLILNSK